MMKKHIPLWLSLIFIIGLLVPVEAFASDIIPGIDLGNSSDPDSVWNTVTIVLLITILSVAPAILILMTCFHPHRHRTGLCQNSACYPADAAQPGIDRTCLVHDLVCDGSNDR